jgi:alkylation response protein AidB-like acyl-CoA dehydrogenase
MALNPLVDSRDVRFVLFEMLNIDRLGDNHPDFADFDRDIYSDMLNLAERIAVEEIYPAGNEGDKEGCSYDPVTHKVKIPKSFKAPLDAYHKAGFLGISDSQTIGGMGMPEEIKTCASEYFLAASIPLVMYPGLTHGAMQVINNYGTEELKKMFIEKMMSGAWGGTMCLTEPDAGSDVGLGKSKAIPQADGTYLISGQSIFISSGENDYYENIIHLKLARIEGDAPGTKGLSIFVVPKYRVKPDGTRGEFNDVVCTGIEHKMGIHGSSTCTLSFGENGKCLGYLLGQEREGMKIMFQMMNEERIGVGIMGLAVSSAAYMHAVGYARSRVQGKHVAQMLNPDAKAVTIINHPDVKRMLLWMKSYVEGMRSFSYFVTHCHTLSRITSGIEQEEAHALCELLRPVIKAGNTDTAVLLTSEAVQVYGGYGYCSDYPVERFMRDSKITTIYEGTNGIQSMDLIMRKILMNKDQYNYAVLRKKIGETIGKARGVVDDKYISVVERGLQSFDDVIEMLKKQMAEGKYLSLFMNACPLEQALFMLLLAWSHLWAMTIAVPRMKEHLGDARGPEREAIINDNGEAAFYSGRVLSARFYLESEFPKYFGRIEAIRSGDTSVIAASSANFTGALEA